MARKVIVVGFDDSPSAAAALRWAAEQARGTGATVRAVNVVEWPVDMMTWEMPMRGTVPYPQAPPPGIEEHKLALRQRFDEANPEPDWRLDFIEGAVGPALVHASAEAELLVVGTREHHGLGRLVHGSTSHHCISHASCPVVAVPAPSHPSDHPGNQLPPTEAPA